MAHEPGIVVAVALAALGDEVLGDGGGVDVAGNVGDRYSRLDLGVVSSHVFAELGRSAAICVVGSGHAPLLNHDVGFGGAVGKSFENVGSEL